LFFCEASCPATALSCSCFFFSTAAARSFSAFFWRLIMLSLFRDIGVHDSGFDFLFWRLIMLSLHAV